jgi:hypothetical protein
MKTSINFKIIFGVILSVIVNSIIAGGILFTTAISFIYLVGKTETLGFIYSLLLFIFLEGIFLFILWIERSYLKKSLDIDNISLKSIWIIEVFCLFVGALSMNSIGIIFFVYILPLSIFNVIIKNTKSLLFMYCFSSFLLLAIIMLSMLLF